jgi:GGDEF domain-containing protein/HAMP domain-containing protein
MTIAGKINALVIGIVVTLGCLVTGFTAHREYRVERDRLVEAAAAQVLNRQNLQLTIYNRDEARLAHVLDGLLESPAIYYVIIYDSQGEVLVRHYQPAAPRFPLPPFHLLRRDLSVIEQGRVALDGKQEPVGDGLLSALAGKDAFIHLVLPVTSAVNPLEKNLSPGDFGFASPARAATGSLHVMGFTHLAINQRALFMGAMPFVAKTFLVCLLFVALCTVVSISVARRITAPLSRLARVADDVASGKLQEPLEIEGSGEIKELAATLIGLVGGLTSYKTRMDVDHQLLSMKVEERTSQLSRRNEELNRAVKQVTQAKDQLRQIAYYDSLTSLPNRRLFTEHLSLLLRLAKRNDQLLALLFLDLDNFKRINDSLGHSAGDLLLREVATRLSSCVRDSDVVTRYVDPETRIHVSRLGGDEFTVVLNQAQGRRYGDVSRQGWRQEQHPGVQQ